MGVTDKAVSKWERDLSSPDINSIHKLAEIFEISIDQLMQVQTNEKQNHNKSQIDNIVNIILIGVGVAMGVAVTVLSILGEIESKAAIVMLGIGLASISIFQPKENCEQKYR